MSNKIIVGSIIIVLLLFLAVFLAYANDYDRDYDKTILNVSSEGPFELSKLTKDIREKEYFRGYDNETLEWMESLGNRYVFSSMEYYVIMDKWDADKIPSVYATDVYINEIFSCEIIENHSLGNTEYPKDVILVRNVEYLNEEVHYFDV